MSDTTPTPDRDNRPTDGSRLTVEDAGSTTHAGDLFHNDTTAGSAAGTPERTAGSGFDDSRAADESRTVDDRDDRSRPVDTVPTASDVPPEPSAPTAPGAPEAPTAPTGGLGALAGDDSIAHVFDQTNGVLDRFDGDSDGTAESDLHSAAERADENPAFEQFADTEAANADGTDDPRVTGN